jgi:hypothetical protein
MKTMKIIIIILLTVTNLFSQTIILEELDGEKFKIKLDSSAIFIINDTYALNGKIISYADSIIKIKSVSNYVSYVYTLNCNKCSKIRKDSVIDVKFSDITRIYKHNIFGRAYEDHDLFDLASYFSTACLISTVPLLLCKKFAIGTATFLTWFVLFATVSFEDVCYTSFDLKNYQIKGIILDEKF